MNELQEKYGPEYAKNNHPNHPHCHLQIFGFPCNQFGYQEPAENFELMNCLKYVRPGFGFVPNFPLSGKLKVNGHEESPVFTFLKSRCPAPMGLIANRTDITWTPIRNNDISWNFAKWLVSSNGHPYKRFTSRTTPAMVEDDILQLLEECVRGDKEGIGNSTQTNSVQGNGTTQGQENNGQGVGTGPQNNNRGTENNGSSQTVVEQSTLKIPAQQQNEPNVNVNRKQKRHVHSTHDLFF